MPASHARRTLARLGRWLLLALAVVVALLVAAPLVLRGPRLGRLVQRATASLCGTVHIDGGRVSVIAAFDLLLGRPTAFAVDGLRIVAPDGEEVFAAGRVSGRFTARRAPWRLDVVDLTITSARFRLVEHGDEGRVDHLDAFRSVPPGASRAVCLVPPRRTTGARAAAPAPRPRPGPAFALRIRRVSLADVDVLLDFTSWALALHRTSTTGTFSLALDGNRGPRLLFEARAIEARDGGSLRVGTRGQRWAAQVPFQRVEIDRFAVDEATPADLVLEVRRAITGQSVLSGTARFTEVFAWGRRARRSGIDLDARWADIGDAMEALKHSWGLSPWMPGRLDGRLTARLQGPFSALTGRVHAAATRADLDVRLSPDLRVDGSARFDDIDTSRFLDRALLPLLGGRLAGEVRVHARLAERALSMTGAVDLASLRLDRTRRGPWPRRWVVSTGAAAIAPGSDDELDVFLGGARLDRGLLQIGDLRATLARARLQGAVAVRLLDPVTGAPLGRPVVDASGQTEGLDVAQFLPGWPVTGRLSVRGTLRGRTDALGVRGQFLPDTAVRLWGQPLELPREVQATVLDGERLVVPRVRLGLPPDGSLAAEASLVLDGPVTASLAVQRYRLDWFPPLPGLAVRLGGWLDAGLRITGTSETPVLAGEIAFSDVAVDGVPLGDGGLSVVPDGAGIRVSGRLVPALGLSGRLQLGRSRRMALALDLRAFPLAPLLGRVAPAVRGQISGTATLEARGRAYTAEAVLDEVEVAVATTRPAGTGLSLSLHNEGPARVRAESGAITAAPFHLRGPGLEIDGQGALDDSGVRARATARVDLGSWTAALRPWLRQASGTVELTVQAEGPVGGPSLRGSARVVETLRLWPPGLLAPFEVGGEVAFVAGLFQAQGLTVALAGASVTAQGEAALTAHDWRATRFDARVTGTVDGAALARRLPGLLNEGHGRARLAGHLGGTAAAPTFDGELVFAGLGGEVVGLPAQIAALDGRVESRGRTLSTRSLTVSLVPQGTLTIGSPTDPARIDLDSLYPLIPGRLSLPLRGQNLAALAPVAGFRVDDLDLDVRLAYDPDGPLRVTGDVWIDSAAFAPGAVRRLPAAGSLRSGARLAKSLFPAITLDLGMHARREGLEVVLANLPDVAVTFDCRLAGTVRNPRLTGRARGRGLYSRAALFFYDVFSGNHVRRCGDPGRAIVRP